MTQGQSIVTKKTGAESFRLSGQPIAATVLDLWRWSMSDFVSNAPRGVVAEFIVANALGLTDGVRNPWDPFDLITPAGIKIEVKSAAYLQFWKQKFPSKIVFPIHPSRTWDHESGVTRLSKDSRRQADVYIFCVLGHKERSSLDPLNLDQWEFYIIPTSALDSRFPRQKSVGLARLIKAGAIRLTYDRLRDSVDQLSADFGRYLT